MDVFISFIGVLFIGPLLPLSLSSKHAEVDLFCVRWPSSSSSSFGRPLPSVSGTSSWLSLGAIRPISRSPSRNHSLHTAGILDYSPINRSNSNMFSTSGVKSAADSVVRFQRSPRQRRILR